MAYEFLENRNWVKFIFVSGVPKDYLCLAHNKHSSDVYSTDINQTYKNWTQIQQKSLSYSAALGSCVILRRPLLWMSLLAYPGMKRNSWGSPKKQESFQKLTLTKGYCSPPHCYTWGHSSYSCKHPCYLFPEERKCFSQILCLT